MLEKLKSNPTVIMVCCALLWSTGGLLLKSIHWHTMVVGSLRGAVATVAILAFMLCTKQKVIINKHTLFTGVMYSITTICYVLANSLTTAANAIVIQSANPIFIIIISSIVFKQRILRRDIVVVCTCAFGIALFFLDSLQAGGTSGNLVALFSAFALSIAYTASAKSADSSATMTGILLGHVITALLGIPFMVQNPPELTLSSVATILFLGVFQLALPYILFSIAIRIAPPLTCSLMGMIEPIANPLWVALAIGEIPGIIALIGGVIVISSVCLWSIANSKAQEASLTL